MAINTGQSTGVIAVLASDTICDETPVGETHEHYGAYVHNTNSSGTVSVEVFVSTDSSSALSERVSLQLVGAGEDKRLPVITIDASSHLLLKGDATGVNFHSTFTKRTGGDV